MESTKESFLKASEKKVFDKNHRKTINFNIDRYNTSVKKGKEHFNNLELARQQAKNTKWKSIENLDQVLLDFETKFTSNGGQVLWANTALDALKHIDDIVKSNSVKTVVKAKTMVTEEIELNEHLEKQQVEVLETDLGEYIVQLAGEKPYHIITPAMHKNKEDIAALFQEKFDLPPNQTPQQVTQYTREKLRKKFTEADLGISGANYVIADSGSVCLTENEGNIRLTTAFPKIHVAIVGIEKVLSNLDDLQLFWPLLSTHGTGQQLTVYNSIISGPKRKVEVDGPEQMIVILLDNGRTNLLAQADQREALYCIRCGACLNACPIYKNVGGHSYQTTYSGPIGSVINPHQKGMKEFGHLSQASSLCGNCTEVCPVRIDLHNMLLTNRHKAVQKKLYPKSEAWSWFFWKVGMMKRSRMQLGSSKFKNKILSRIFGKSWGKHRTLPEVADKSFAQQWEETRSE